jgi:hypothetical protein
VGQGPLLTASLTQIAVNHEHYLRGCVIFSFEKRTNHREISQSDKESGANASQLSSGSGHVCVSAEQS